LNSGSIAIGGSAPFDAADFEAVTPDPRCPHCATNDGRPLPGVDAIYCISLREQPERAARVVAHFHEIGLCRGVTMYRPRAGVYVTMAIWRSHRAVALHALASGARRALVLEDDVLFRAKPAEIRERVREAIDRLPTDWWGLFLGHFPFQAYTIAPGVMRVRSGCLHAYIANAPLLDWFARTEPMDPQVSLCWLGQAVDSAVANLPAMFAVEPMLATQKRFKQMRADTASDLAGGFGFRYLRGLRDRAIIYGLMRPGAQIVKSASPIHRATLEWLRLRPSARQLSALAVWQSGLFDGRWYLERYPDVAAADVHPLVHYLNLGGFEGRWPGPLFDTEHYMRQIPAPRRLKMNPLVHYVTRGASEGYDPNAMFDSSWYLRQYPDARRFGGNPLAHFAGKGWREGCDPSPRFSCAEYLRAHPEVATAGVNPLEHYLAGVA
jgi:hypothetical protein